MEGQDRSNLAYVIAVANAVISVMFLFFGARLFSPTIKARFRRNRAFTCFRRALGELFLTLGLFFGWIMLAWASVLPFDERIQAVMLMVCAGLSIRMIYCWQLVPSEDKP